MEDINEPIKRMDIQEFRCSGYLQEINRLFLHPLGLALEIVLENGTEKLGGIWDYRDDPEGIVYDISNSDQERKDIFLKKKKFIEEQFDKFRKEREKLFGSNIEPIE